MQKPLVMIMVLKPLVHDHGVRTCNDLDPSARGADVISGCKVLNTGVVL